MIRSIALVCIAAFSSAYANLVVIGNIDLKENRLTRSQISNFYLGKSSTLHMQTITPLNLSEQEPLYAQFYRSMVGWSVDQVSSYWAQQVFGGTAQQPQAVASMQAAIQYVRKTPGAIAYVDTDKLQTADALAGIKLLYGRYTGVVGSSSLMPAHSSRHLPAPWKSKVQSAEGLVSQAASLYALHQDLSAHTGYPNAVNFKLPTVNPNQDLWRQIKLHFKLQQYYNLPAVVQQRNLLLRHRATLNMMLINAIPYIAYVDQQALIRGEPAELVLLPMLESAYNPFAYSRVGAAGLWQMMPQTAVLYGLKISWWYDSRRDVLLSTRAALDYLQSLHKQFNSWPLGLASYDAGAGTVQKAIKRNQARKVGAHFWQLLLPGETRAYVPKLLAIASIIDNADQYDISLPALSVEPFFTTVTLNSQLDLSEISKMAGISNNLIRYLNPGLRRFATSNEGQYTLLLPSGSLSLFRSQYNANLGKSHISWQFHEIYKGETLKKIAHDYHTSVALLQRINNLSEKDSKIALGQGVLVPLYLGAKYTRLGHVGVSHQVAKIAALSATNLLASKGLLVLPQPAQTKPIDDHKRAIWEFHPGLERQRWFERIIRFSLYSMAALY